MQGRGGGREVSTYKKKKTNNKQEGQCGCESGGEESGEAGKKDEIFEERSYQLVGEKRKKGRCIVTTTVTIIN